MDDDENGGRVKGSGRKEGAGVQKGVVGDEKRSRRREE